MALCSGSSSRGRKQSHKAWSQLRLRKPAAGLSGLPGPSMCSRPLAGPSLRWPALLWAPPSFPQSLVLIAFIGVLCSSGVPSSFLKIVCLFLAVLGPCLRRLFPGCGEQAPLSGCAARPVPCSAFSGGARAPGDRLGSRGPGLSCSAGCGVFWIRGQSYVSRTGR